MRFIFFVCAAFLFSKAAAGSDYIKVVDGDSLFIGKREIRLSGIDAPEYHQECYDENDAPYPCGKEAFWALKKMAGKNIVCKKVTVDRYRREVADCFCGKKNINKAEIFKELLPQDLLKFGLIPEFVGRLPITATLDGLTREALIDIVTKPKNALVKQYKKLIEFDGVELEFEEDALEIIVDKAIERNTGARGLRSIIEEIMRDIMYDIPSNQKIVKCIITKETVENKEQPKLIIDENKKREPMKIKKKIKNAKTQETA